MNADENGPSFDVAAILERVKAVVGAQNDNQLAKIEGLAQTTISTWRSKGRVPFELCSRVSLKHKVPLDFLIFGNHSDSPYPYTSIGYIDAFLYKGCIKEAKKVISIKPDLDIFDVVAALYNMWVGQLNDLEKRGLSYEQALAVLEYLSEMPDSRMEAFAEEASERVRKYVEQYSQIRSKMREYEYTAQALAIQKRS